MLVERKQYQMKVVRMLAIICLATCMACGGNDPVSFKNIQGGWNCTETSSQGQRTYGVDIYRTKNDSTVYLISNFHNMGTEGDYDIKVTLVGKKLTVMPTPQAFPNSYLVLKLGTATVHSFTHISFDYVIYNGFNDLAIHTEYTR